MPIIENSDLSIEKKKEIITQRSLVEVLTTLEQLDDQGKIRVLRACLAYFSIGGQIGEARETKR